MRAQYKRKKPKKQDTEKKQLRIFNWVFYTLLALSVFQLFMEAETIGHDTRYFYWIILLPVLTGLVCFLYFGYGYFKSDFTGIEKMYQKILVGFLLLVFIVFMSLISFGTIARATLDYCNRSAAEKKQAEVVYCDVTKFQSGKHCSIKFKFNKENEYFGISYKTYKSFADKAPGNYQLEITIQKGVWKYYVVNSWNIIDKTKE